MKKLILFTFLPFFVSCCSKHYQKFSYNYSANPWIDCFKDQAFFAALRESYKSDTLIFKLIEKKDAFNPYDGLPPDAYQKAKSMGINIIKNIPAPAMCENCKGEINYYMSICLKFYESKELDSVAKIMYKKYKKSQL